MNDMFFMVVDGGAEGAEGVRELLAANLRRLRIARHLSLSELARATDMSKATLSGIENARANPTVETLASLAVALGVALGELLEREAPGELRVVRAARGGYERRDGVARRALERLAPGGGVEIAELMLAARQLHEVQSGVGGARAHVYVLQGKVIAGPVERSTELSAGDYASFPADAPHVYEAGAQPARLLLLVRASN